MADEKKVTKARVLVDHEDFKVNDIVTGDDAARGHAAGWADGHPDAVAHAEKIAARKAREAQEAEEAE